MSLTETFALLGMASVFGGLISSLVTHLLQSQRDQQQMLFSARQAAYAEVMHALNFGFLKGSTLEDNFAKDFRTRLHFELGPAFSKARLLAGKELELQLREVWATHFEAWPKEKLDEVEQEKKNAEFTAAFTKMELLMKKELHVK